MKDKSKLPKSAITLYVKLFCKKKENMRSSSSSEYKMLRATSSWLSLSEKEKQQFVDKLRVLQISYKKAFANYLKDAELFMKKKCPKQVSDNVTLNSTIEHISDIEDVPSQPNDNIWLSDNMTLNSTIEHNSNIEDVPSQPNDNICMNADYEKQLSINGTHEVLYPKLPEPVPPNIKNAKELFELIQKNKGSNSCWSTLTAPEKRRYQNALLSLKKEYIKRYKEYLECLSSKELFCHYNKVI